MKKRTIYLLAERGSNTYCKIGKDSNWPFRYHKAQSHNPRGLDVVGAWHFECDLKQLGELERLAHKGLPLLDSKTVKEWFALPPADALQIMKDRFGSNPNETLNRPPKPYDDWRKKSDKVKGETYKRRIWINIEETPDYYIKLSHSIFYDTYYSYKFTYNFRDIWLASGFEWSVNHGGPSENYAATNRYVEKAWEDAMDIFGNGPESETVGWLKPSTIPLDLKIFFESKGLVQFDVKGPKPCDCLPQDPECSKNYAVGERPVSDRLTDVDFGF